MTNYDIIGDIHGHADELEILLQKLGYQKLKGVYRHPSRQAIFLGDFIDRGPNIRGVLHIVKDMVDAGFAQAIMGNHEFNAVCFATKNKIEGGYFREHSVDKIKQHLKTLEQFRLFPKEWDMFLTWFKHLPMFLELDHCKMVHAYWNDNHIAWLKKNYHPTEEGLSHEFLANCYQKELPGFKPVEETLKGPEHKLPEGQYMVDKEGILREECRLRWWAIEKETMGQGVMECPDALVDDPMPEGVDLSVFTSDKPVFFGHYWLSGIPKIVNEHAICLDYSVAKGGKLVAARITDGKISLIY